VRSSYPRAGRSPTFFDVDQVFLEAFQLCGLCGALRPGCLSDQAVPAHRLRAQALEGSDLVERLRELSVDSLTIPGEIVPGQVPPVRAVPGDVVPGQMVPG